MLHGLKVAILVLIIPVFQGRTHTHTHTRRKNTRARWRFDKHTPNNLSRFLQAGVGLNGCLPLFSPCLRNPKHLGLHHSARTGRAAADLWCFCFFSLLCSERVAGPGQRVLQPQLRQPGLVERQGVGGKTAIFRVICGDAVQPGQTPLHLFFFSLLLPLPTRRSVSPTTSTSSSLFPELRSETRELPCLLGRCSFLPDLSALPAETHGMQSSSSVSLLPQTPEKKPSESSRGRKRKADTYSESSQGNGDACQGE